MTDRQFVVLPFGIKNHVTLTARDACRVRMFNPITGALVIEQSLAAGEAILLEESKVGEALVVLGDR